MVRTVASPADDEKAPMLRPRAPGTGRILYIVSRFPTISETFIVNEWLKVSELLPLELVSLARTHDRRVHPQSASLLRRVHFVALLSPRTIGANARLAIRAPRRYLATLKRTVAGSRGAKGGMLLGAVLFWKSVRIADVCRELEITHVHSHFMSRPTTCSWVVHKLTGLPFSATAHAHDIFRRPALFREKMRDCAFVATISEYNREYLRAQLGSASRPRIEIVHCGVDVELFTFRPRTRLQRLITVARLEDQKGVDDLLLAFASLHREFPRLSLTIVGDGSRRRSLAGLARSKGLEGRVRFTGILPADEVRLALDGADLFVLPARPSSGGRIDGIPVALMEAMACGLPVVSTSLSGIPELVIDGETGLLVPPGQSTALAAAIRSLVADPSRARDLAEAGRRHVVEHFDLAREADKLAGLFAEVKVAVSGVDTS
jgi:glycosyltransferase involved in cell wall biosynthesis